MWGWLKGVGKILKPVVKYIPGVGPALDDAMDIAGAIGGAASGAADSMAKNRGANADLEMQRQQLMLNAERERNQAAGDSWKRLLQMAYVGGPASQRVQTPGFSRYSKPIAGPTFQQWSMANNPAYRQPLMDRAAYRTNPVDFSRLEKQQKMGGWEKLLGIVGGAAPVVGSVLNSRKPVDYSAFDNPNNWG